MFASVRPVEAIAYRLSTALAIVSGVAGGASFVFWRVFERDVPATIGNLRGTALTLVAIVLPIMLWAMRQTARGSIRARLVWLACLAYVAYNAVMFLFASAFNAFFLAYAAMLALVFWSIITLVPTIERESIARAGQAVPARAIAAYLVVCCVLFAGLWLTTVLPATLSNTMPAVITQAGVTQNTVWVLDFAFTFPLMLVGATWLWQRKAWGYVIGGMMLLMLTLETAGVAVDQWFGHLHDPSAPLAAVPLMGAFTAAGLVFSAVFLSRLRQGRSGFPLP